MELPLHQQVEQRLPDLLDLMSRHEMSVLGRVETTPVEAAGELRHPDLDTNLSIVVIQDDRVLALRLVLVEAAERDVLWDCWVDPDLPADDRKALLARLCDGAVRAAATLADRHEPDRLASPDQWQASTESWQLAAGAYRQDADWRAALADIGVRQVRTFQRMRIEHGLAVPAPETPTGVTVQDVQDESDLRIAHRINEEAFADHWGGEPPRTFPAWLDFQRTFSGFDSSRWTIALLHNEPVGFIAGSTSRDEKGIGYVPLLGVLRSARGRGIARFLLMREFARSAARGLPATELTVDSDSPTGADRLYRSVGMTPTVTIDSFLRPI